MSGSFKQYKRMLKYTLVILDTVQEHLLTSAALP